MLTPANTGNSIKYLLIGGQKYLSEEKKSTDKSRKPNDRIITLTTPAPKYKLAVKSDQ